jgi:hypothetical protein
MSMISSRLIEKEFFTETVSSPNISLRSQERSDNDTWHTSSIKKVVKQKYLFEPSTFIGEVWQKEKGVLIQLVSKQASWLLFRKHRPWDNQSISSLCYSCGFDVSILFLFITVNLVKCAELSGPAKHHIFVGHARNLPQEKGTVRYSTLVHAGLTCWCKTRC